MLNRTPHMPQLGQVTRLECYPGYSATVSALERAERGGGGGGV